MEAIYTTNYFEIPQAEYLQTAEFLEEESPEKSSRQKESSPTSLDKLKLPNEKQTETNSPQKTKLKFLDQDNALETESSCQDHEGEELQFFSFTNNKALCPECLVSGAYVGCKVASLKKAADQIKPKYEDMIVQIVEKTKKLEPYENKLENKKIDLEGSVTEYKLEITEQFEKLRTAINNKEKEILEQIEKAKEEKEVEIKNQQKALKATFEDLSTIQKLLESRIDSFKELDFCQFYARKAKPIQNFVEEETASLLKRLMKEASKTENFKEQLHVNDYHDEITTILERLNGPSIGSFGVHHTEHKFTLTPRYEEKPLDSDSSRSIVIHKDAGGSTLENTPAPTIPVLSKIALTLPTSRKSSANNGRCSSPFEVLEEDLAITPLSGYKETSNGEETLRRLFDKVDTGRTLQQREVKDSRQDLRSHSSAAEKGKSRGKEILKKNWEIKHEELEKNCKKCQVLPSTIKLADLDSKKNFPRSYIPEFSSRNTSPSEIATGRGKKEINLTSAKELLSAMSLRKLSRDEASNKTGSTWNLEFKRPGRVNEEEVANKTGPTWNLELKRPGRTNEEASHVNRSHGSSSLSSNLRKLKKQMGLGDFNN